MNLHESADQHLLRESLARLLEGEASLARLRAAEPLGFDAALWRELGAFGLPGMRVPAERGGGGFGLHEAMIVLEQLGRHLAAVPAAEAMVAARLLAQFGASEALDAVLLEGALVVLAPLPLAPAGTVLVPGGAAADGIILLHASRLLLLRPNARLALARDLGNQALARIDAGMLAAMPQSVLAEGDAAEAAYAVALDEWRLLAAAQLNGLARRALELAGDYAREREAFGRKIGSFQGLAHPLAESVAEITGADLLLRDALAEGARGGADAPALFAFAWWWSTQAASRAVARALHVFGGYGLSLDYDIQLYHRRGKAWAARGGDPQAALLLGAERLWRGAAAPLPKIGETSLDFSLGAAAEAFRAEARAYFVAQMTPELRAKAHFSFEGVDFDFQAALAEGGLLFPDWPPHLGGRGRTPYEMEALRAVFNEFQMSRLGISVTSIVGRIVLEFGSAALQEKVIPEFLSGRKICSLGYSEPSGGSDVFAARTRAVRDGDDWVINGQKMFTSGANISSYVLLLARTDASAAKHLGLTMFLVPTSSPGYDVAPIFTISDERTNITWYADVRIPDMYRIGPVGGAARVMARALTLEQTGSAFALDHTDMVARAVDWAQQSGAMENPLTRARLARFWVHSRIGFLLGRRVVFNRAEGIDDRAAGPISKLFTTENYIRDAADMTDIAAPESLVTLPLNERGFELDYRLSTATSIYGGTSEVMRSLVAETVLNLPRSRS